VGHARRFLTALALLAASAAGADIADTLQRIAQAALTVDGVMTAEVQADRDQVAVTLQSGTTVTLYGGNLDAVLGGLTSEAERSAAVRDFVAVLAAVDTPAAGVDLARVMPVVAGPGLDAGDGAPAMDETPFAPGLALYHVVDDVDSVDYLTVADLNDAGLTAEAVAGAALQNLSAYAGNATVEVITQDPWVAFVTLDNFYEGSLLALPVFWDGLAAEHGRIGVAYPARGVVFVFDAGNPLGVDFVAGPLLDHVRDNPYPVSQTLLEWAGRRWVELAAGTP
jgi:hypothetical protein